MYRGSTLSKSFLDKTAVCHGEDLHTSCENFYACAWKSLVLYTHGNELRQIHLITGAPRGVNPSLIIIIKFIRCVSIHGEDLYISR